MDTETDTGRGTRRRPRARALVPTVLAALTALAAALLPAPPANADPMSACTATKGAVVAVDFGPFGGKLERGCDASPTTGFELLRDAGFVTTGTVHDGPAFLCRIGLKDGTQYPTPDREACRDTPGANAYWSYWVASPGQKKWKYSQYGAMSRTLRPGDVDAWVFGATDIGGTKGGPSFTPDDVRAGALPTDPKDPPVPNVPPAAAKVDKAVGYLTKQLTEDGTHVDDGEGGVRYQLTVDTALALAAVDRKSPAAREIADFVGTPERVTAYLFPEGPAKAPDATAAARLALLAEALERDPRAVGGRDLLKDLTDHVCGVPGQAGTPQDCLTEGDIRSTFQAEGHALAVIALVNGGVTPPSSVVRRLASLQCEDGGFTSILLRAGECESEPAATGLLTLALKTAGGDPEALKAARTWLAGHQQADGSYASASYPTAGNPSSTAWAVQALRSLGQGARAKAAASWTAAQQQEDGGFPFEKDDGGGSNLYATTGVVITAADTDIVALTAKPAPPVTPPTGPPGEGPNLAKGTAFLTDRKNLIKARYYEGENRGTGRADFGLTIDGAYALAATGTDDDHLAAIVEFVEKGGKDSEGRGIDDYTMIGTPYAAGGSIGKTALLAQAVRHDPRAFGGHDLIKALADVTCAEKSAAPDRSCAARGNYRHASSVFKQSLGLIAQLRAGETTAAAAPLGYLLSLQNTDGSWPSIIPPTPGDSEVDSTAMAAMAAAASEDPAAKAAAAKAVTWLAGRQQADGGFPGASGNSVNSAALAVQGLSLAGAEQAGPIAKARKFLAAHQNADGGFPVAVDAQPGSDVRASTQALGGSTGISFAALSRDISKATPPPADPGPDPDPGQSPKPSTPPIVTPGDTAGTGGGSSGGSSGGSTSGSTTGSTGGSSTGGTGGGGPLASTGTQVTLVAALAALLLAAGGAVLVATRRRATPAAGPGTDEKETAR
ncbi:prenyltransferase/squalene oxidase repeat-containing protein (plasmid) [Streptomyces sp. BI20]|uniref:prenyltransferase/squalene oxidase repeat-containing protein n=1 Tax=Streptomyces sp. BI20 TaxID=3403460 RepID=UPI003C740E12